MTTSSSLIYGIAETLPLLPKEEGNRISPLISPDRPMASYTIGLFASAIVLTIGGTAVLGLTVGGVLPPDHGLNELSKGRTICMISACSALFLGILCIGGAITAEAARPPLPPFGDKYKEYSHYKGLIETHARPHLQKGECFIIDSKRADNLLVYLNPTNTEGPKGIYYESSRQELPADLARWELTPVSLEELTKRSAPMPNMAHKW